MSELFNVVQFFEDDSYEYVRTAVQAQEAVSAAKHYCTSVGARMGVVKRVIITDAGDSTFFEWRRGVGQVWPPPRVDLGSAP